MVSMVAYTNYNFFTAVLCSYATAQFGSHFISFWEASLTSTLPLPCVN